jgi:hypothetical protein
MRWHHTLVTENGGSREWPNEWLRFEGKSYLKIARPISESVFKTFNSKSLRKLILKSYQGTVMEPMVKTIAAYVSKNLKIMSH